ncbi:type II toxin-antitoxin system HipA family toxin [Solicola gregarius]|uniref:HipA domain-containing protein n=1 Tax=Solicola gregarius TaxID=2908642 RepID=A0AA46TG78_9ACTN|nr:HipA domain-containing protein [Solicola gregarius]UYM04675.1 HipA domain-containing protein [Solicola gregarius]
MSESSAESTPAPADYTEVQRADVYKAGRLAAHLERVSGGVEFRYDDDWLAGGGPPVATSLPPTRDPTLTASGAVPAFFAGLLPEGRRLSALRRSVKTSADDELSLVLAVGTDVIGDVQVVPEGVAPQRAGGRVRVDDFTEIRFRTLLEGLDIDVDRTGLPGVQDKASLTMLNVPVSTAGSSYLLKLSPPEYPYVVENEHFFLAAARGSGLTVADADVVHDADGEPGLVVRRFDRVRMDDGEPRALAVEDGCQVLGLHPEAKYRISTERVFTRLCSLCEAPIPAARTLLSQLAFAYVSGNGDAHAKNFSILQDIRGRWMPSPAYDMPTTLPYGDTTLALSIAGKRDGNVSAKRFVALGVELGLPERAARRVVVDVADAVDTWIDGVDDLPFDGGRRAKLKKTIAQRQRMLRGR